MTHLENSPFQALHYQWELIGTENRTMTVLSKMIKFRGEKSFRIGLKNQAPVPTLLFLTTNLNKMGIRVVSVLFRSQTVEYETMTLKTSNEDETGTIQLFTAPLAGIVTGNRNFIFQIFITGIIQDYRVELIDRLLCHQLWSSVKSRIGTDFELIAGRTRFPVHKFILAARSPMFASLFANSKSVELQQKVESVDASTMAQFLKFVYTGELEGPIKGSQLMYLATTYKIKSLEKLCQAASHDIDGDQLAILALQLKPEVDQYSTDIKSSKDTEINIISNSGVLKFVWNTIEPSEESVFDKSETSGAFEYQNEKLFRAQTKTWKRMIPNPSYYANRGSITNREPATVSRHEFTLIFLGYNHSKINCKIEEVTYSIEKDDRQWSQNVKMKEKQMMNDEKVLQVFTSMDRFSIPVSPPFTITFHVKLHSAAANFGHKLIDSTFKEHLWAAAVNKQMTDVEILVGEESFAAHRFLLSARSPIFAAMFASGMKDVAQIRIDDVSPSTFLLFLQFLYTGTLPSSAKKEKLYQMADKYQIDTLVNICRPATHPVDLEELTSIFLSC